MKLPSCETSQALTDLVAQTGRKFQVLGTTVFGHELICVRTGGDKEPAIVIAAGSHAGEPGGVYGALNLIERVETDHAVYIVPLRDPFGWGGFARCLSSVLGERVVLETHADADLVLTKYGHVVYTEAADTLIVSFIGDMVFATNRPKIGKGERREIAMRLNRAMAADPRLAAQLIGVRLCWPTNKPGVEGCNLFDRAYSEFVTRQAICADLNRHFTHAFPPTEVHLMRQLVDRIRPGLTLDLHEGQGDKFYIFTSPYPDRDPREDVGKAALGAVASKGYGILTVAELSTILSDGGHRELNYGEPVPGLMVSSGNRHEGLSFASYCTRYGVSMTLETGRWTSLAARADMQVTGALGAIARWEEMQR